MKHNQIKPLSLTLLAILSSCGGPGNIEGTVYAGDAFTKRNAIVLEYNLPKVLSEGARISGRIYAQENADVSNNYVLSYSSTSPLSGASTYSESGILSCTKEMIEASREGLKFNLELSLSSVFPSKSEEGTVYFVIHAVDWVRTDITTYGFTSYKYVWEGENVKLQLD